MARSKGTSAAAAAVVLDDDKAARVDAERARLLELFAGADGNKMDFIKCHVQQLAWLNVSIVELQEKVDAVGAVVQYDNGGNQRGLQQNPACKLLVDYEKLSNTIFRALLPVLPDRPRKKGKLEQFMNDIDDE